LVYTPWIIAFNSDMINTRHFGSMFKLCEVWQVATSVPSYLGDDWSRFF
jgi:hypothetical protein